MEISGMSGGVFGRAAASAEGLSKSVLGTLSLFLLLVYFIGSVTLVAARLSDTNQSILVGFIVLFPVIVLFVFYSLVTRHFGKIVNPDKVDQQTYARIALAQITTFPAASELRPSKEIENERDAVVGELASVGDDSPERQILFRILDWNSPEWREKRHNVTNAAATEEDAVTIMRDENVARSIVDVYRFLDFIATAVKKGSISSDKIPTSFKRSAIRYLARGGRFLEYMRGRKPHKEHFRDFEDIAREWQREREAQSV